MKIRGKNYPVSNKYYFNTIMTNLVKYLDSTPFDSPIFIYLECNFNNKNNFYLLSNSIKRIFSDYLLIDKGIDYTIDSPFDERFNNKIIFVSNENYVDDDLLSSKIIYPPSDTIKPNSILNFSYSRRNDLDKYKNTLTRVYIENIILSTNQAFIKNCNIFSINFLPDEKNYIEYNNFMKLGYVLIQ
jgi:hypothetical protein